MKINIGDLVHVQVSVHDFILLEGIGVVMERGDPDCPKASASTWLIFCENDYWAVDEKHITKIESRRLSKNITCGPKKSVAKEIRNLAKNIKSSKL